MFGPRRRWRRGPSRGSGLGLMLLAGQLYQIGLNRIPPVTLATLIAQVTIFLNVWRRFNVRLPRIRDACVSVVHVWHHGQWRRLLWASFLHVDEWHLYYNMASFVWKGLSVERRMGSARFLYVLAVFSLLVNLLLVALNVLAVRVLEEDRYYTDCAVGFSGVIFALKVLTTYDLPSGHVTSVMGLFAVPTRLACWVELVVTSLLFPNVSFVGHLAGILVGMLYVRGPLHGLMHGIFVGPSESSRRFVTSSYQHDYTHSYHGGSNQQRHQYNREVERVTGDNTANSSDNSPEVQAAIAASLRASRGGHLRPLSTRQSNQFKTRRQVASHNVEDDDPELQRAIRQSLEIEERETQPVAPSAPPEDTLGEQQYSNDTNYTGIQSNIDLNHLREARLARFQRNT